MRIIVVFFFSSRRRHTRYWRDWSSDVCSSDLKRKLNTNEKKTQLASTKKKMSMKDLSKTGESYVNRKLANVWGKKFKATQGKRRIFQIGRAPCRERV